jgi:hypothetical protein
MGKALRRSTDGQPNTPEILLAEEPPLSADSVEKLGST